MDKIEIDCSDDELQKKFDGFWLYCKSLDKEIKKKDADIIRLILENNEYQASNDYLMGKSIELHEEIKKLDDKYCKCIVEGHEALFKIKKLRELNIAYVEYIKLLDKELCDLIPMAVNKGWKSNLVEEGIKVRDKIKALKESE